MKTLIMLVALICWALPLSAKEINLEGKGVIHYKYPEKFQESNHYIRKGTTTKNGDCEFNNTMRLEAGQRIFTKELAYNPYTCESLIIEGLYIVEPQKKLTEHLNIQLQLNILLRQLIQSGLFMHIYGHGMTILFI